MAREVSGQIQITVTHGIPCPPIQSENLMAILDFIPKILRK
jgi:hypothetical protein